VEIRIDIKRGYKDRYKVDTRNEVKNEYAKQLSCSQPEVDHNHELSKNYCKKR
jgi:hypothetical protein